jgi:hypothetical protein
MNLQKINSRRARRVMLGLAALAVVLVAVVIAASAGGSTSTNTAASSRPAASAGTGTSTSRTAFQKCLKEHGVTIAPHAAGNGTRPTRAHRRDGARPAAMPPIRPRSRRVARPDSTPRPPRSQVPASSDRAAPRGP